MNTVNTSRILVVAVAMCLSFHASKAQERDSFITKIVGGDTFLTEAPMAPGARLADYIPPAFSGDLNIFLKENQRLQRDENGRLTTGRVTVLFTVSREGNIVNPRVIKSTNDLLNEEALRVMRLMPRWLPAEMDGQKIESGAKVLELLFGAPAGLEK